MYFQKLNEISCFSPQVRSVPNDVIQSAIKKEKIHSWAAKCQVERDKYERSICSSEFRYKKINLLKFRMWKVNGLR